jgi:hypothetical protein
VHYPALHASVGDMKSLSGHVGLGYKIMGVQPKGSFWDSVLAFITVAFVQVIFFNATVPRACPQLILISFIFRTLLLSETIHMRFCVCEIQHQPNGILGSSQSPIATQEKISTTLPMNVPWISKPLINNPPHHHQPSTNIHDSYAQHAR